MTVYAKNGTKKQPVPQPVLAPLPYSREMDELAD
jgi:hypothetical protein